MFFFCLWCVWCLGLCGVCFRFFGVVLSLVVFLIDDVGILRYRGQIDDNAQEPKGVQVHYLQNAIAAVLSGEEVSQKWTKPIGSPLKWRL